MAPGDLQEVLKGLRLDEASHAHPDLLVGLGRADGAAVFRVTDDVAIVEPVDFFPPVVDDPYTWGAVAAANAMSDIYAMGGQVLFALAIAGFPRELPKSIVTEVFRGGADKVAEAGGIIAGGHTVVDPEPKYGLCVTGCVHPRQIFIKGGLREGDRLFLTKPLGTGVIVTAAKNDAAGDDALQGAIRSMLRLNRTAAEIGQALGVRAATDITGFGLLGHVAEMVEASRAGVTIDTSRLPLLDGALALAEKGHWSGGMKRNRSHLEATMAARLSIARDLPPALIGLLFESETSGGLFFAVPVTKAPGVRERFEASGDQCWEIGEVTREVGIHIT